MRLKIPVAILLIAVGLLSVSARAQYMNKTFQAKRGSGTHAWGSTKRGGSTRGVSAFKSSGGFRRSGGFARTNVFSSAGFEGSSFGRRTSFETRSFETRHPFSSSSRTSSGQLGSRVAFKGSSILGGTKHRGKKKQKLHREEKVADFSTEGTRFGNNNSVKFNTDDNFVSPKAFKEPGSTFQAEHVFTAVDFKFHHKTDKLVAAAPKGAVDKRKATDGKDIDLKDARTPYERRMARLKLLKNGRKPDEEGDETGVGGEENATYMLQKKME